MKKTLYSLLHLVFVLLALNFTGCASYSRSISLSEPHTPNDAYIYGNFEIYTKRVALGLDGYQTMGFSISCNDNQNYIIRFSIEDPLQVIKVNPSTCSFNEIVYTNADGIIRSRKPPPKGSMQNMRIKPNTAYYFGDYKASITFSYSGTYSTTRWRMNSIKNNFKSTTKDMKYEFPKLKQVDTVNILPLMLMKKKK